jgi:parallel beta-helix repeat protein
VNPGSDKATQGELMKRSLVFAIVIALMLAVFAASAMAETHIYISQTTGVNSAATAGTEANPFKSIAYGMMTMASRSTPDPWVVHIKAGTYDADPAKPASQREVFPIALRQGMTIQGDDVAANCIISGEFNPNSQVALLKGDTLTGITIKNLTLTKMTRTTGNGAAAELLKCAGVMQGCIVSINNSSYGIVYLTIPVGGRFDVSDNVFSGNTGSGFYAEGAFTGDISGNTFSGNSSYYGGGFYVYGAFSGNIFGNTFRGNRAYSGTSSSGGGFYVRGSFTGNISDNTFSGNSVEYAGGGFYVEGGFTGNISDNTFSGNSVEYVGGGFCIYSVLTGNISMNTFSGNSDGFDVRRGLMGNVSGNTFSGNSSLGFRAQETFTGNVFGNTFSGNREGGFYSSYTFTGNVSANIFSGNGNSDYTYGGFTLVNITGDISGNTFSGNKPRGFYARGKVTGHISSNVFSRNSAYSNIRNGLGFALDFSSYGGDNAIVSDNFFLYNTGADTSTNTLNGTGIYSGQNVTIVNNTFYNSKPGESAVSISVEAPNSIIRNNIFANVHTPIWEQTALNLPITNNDFYGATDILYRNNQPMYNDADYIALQLADFQNNKTWAPGFVGEGLAMGNWTANPVYDPATNLTTLTDSTKSWTPGRWKGAMLRTQPTSNFQHFPIVNNTANQIMVMGNLTVTSLVNNGNDYTIDDYRLASGSQNIDAGTSISSISKDFEGDPRPSGAGFDIGADEYSVVSTSGPGDLNGVGGVDLADAIIALKIVAGINVGNIAAGADVNSDNKIGLEEVIYILQKVAGLR